MLSAGLRLIWRSVLASAGVLSPVPLVPRVRGTEQRLQLRYSSSHITHTSQEASALA